MKLSFINKWLAFNFQNASNRIDMISSLVLGSWSFMAIFFYCELGERVTSQFEDFCDELSQCCWYSFPIELQRMLVVVISNAQQSSTIRGYGNTICSRFSFNQVHNFNTSSDFIEIYVNVFICFQTVKLGFSYFTMLHHVETWTNLVSYPVVNWRDIVRDRAKKNTWLSRILTRNIQKAWKDALSYFPFSRNLCMLKGSASEFSDTFHFNM